MDRPNIQGRVPDTITTRLPGGESDGAGDATGDPSDDGVDDDTDGADSRRWTTLLTLAGLGLTALGVGLRYVLDSRGDSTVDDEDDADGTELDRDAAGTVEIVGDSGTDATAANDRADRTERVEDTDERDTSTADSAAETETDVTVETFAADRADAEADVAADDGQEAVSDDGPPRIAPLVGMVALVGIRLFVERVRNRYADAPERAAG